MDVINREGSSVDIVEGGGGQKHRDPSPRPRKVHIESCYVSVFLDCWFFAVVLMSSAITSNLSYNNFSFKPVVITQRLQ